MKKSQIGKLGEDFCTEYLEKRGYKILQRNFHSRYGEIDVIAENETYLVFVEVKTRSHNKIAEPKDAVDFSKQRKICLTALSYFDKYPMTKQPRFDVFEVLHKDMRIYNFNYIENAFEFDERVVGKF